MGVCRFSLHPVYVHMTHFKSHEWRPGVVCTSICQVQVLGGETRVIQSGGKARWELGVGE